MINIKNKKKLKKSLVVLKNVVFLHPQSHRKQLERWVSG